MHSITFNQITSSSRGFTVESVDIGYPSERTAEVTIPYRHSTLDTNELQGIKVYEDRTITVKMWMKCNGPDSVDFAKHNALDWLMSPIGRVKLIDSLSSAYYYLAKCSSVDTSASTGRVCNVTATFKAYPYRYDTSGGTSL